ncbi:flagellar basal body-associated FliL family protein [Oceanicoccus sagamiensis]|uniref:Flagellar protein FliL n=1 Tax=Oceanicoccus sagamiensis TaxID=716816 RepID=A0A1X9NBJ8_9GAMM|nr:flagellar basal body-associated FliL family protein [Oceanicoccus sagamiensis]ARN75418.1 flagellar protein [Oceanicoccus sagamiensis]
MAEENEDQDVEEVPAEKKPMSGKTKMIIMIVVGLLVLAASIGGTLFALGFFDSDEVDLELGDGDEAVEQVIDNKPKPAMYFPIKPAFVVSFPSRGKQRYLQVDVTVLTREMAVFNAMQTHMPLIKNRLVMLFGGEIYDELQTDEGKELLRQKALETLQQVMQDEIGKPGIEEVLFTNFVMQ